MGERARETRRALSQPHTLSHLHDDFVDVGIWEVGEVDVLRRELVPDALVRAARVELDLEIED